MSHVFISYSKRNRAYARKLADHLAAQGFDYWIDDRIDFGEEWSKVIFKAIEDCAALIVIMTPKSEESKWVQREVGWADHLEKPLFPLLLEGENWPIFVRTQYADVRDGSLPPDDFCDRLADYAPRQAQAGADVTEASAPTSPPARKTKPRRPPEPPPPFDVTAAINEFYAARSESRWADALAALTRIRESGQVPGWFGLAQREQEIEQEVQAEVARAEEARQRRVWEAARDREYDLVRAVARHDTPARAKAALRGFWETYPGHDPDGLAEQARLFHDILDLLPPPFEWCEIPAGDVTLITEKGWAKNYVPEGGSTTFPVARFGLARYPTTNAQFQVFVDAPDGYSDPVWWDYSSDAQAWRAKNDRPEAPAWDGPPDHPRVNVTWYEAAAYCRWLSSHLLYEVRLSAETEWQRAAQGDDGRKYPWGNEEPDETRANWRGKKGQTTPVGSYPEGASPYGVLDMAGNVWEWCATDYNTGSSDVSLSAETRVLRGGSWSSVSPESLRAAYRYRNPPDLRSYNRGFRPARS